MCTSDSIKMRKEGNGIILLKCSYATHLIYHHLYVKGDKDTIKYKAPFK